MLGIYDEFSDEVGSSEVVVRPKISETPTASSIIAIYFSGLWIAKTFDDQNRYDDLYILSNVDSKVVMPLPLKKENKVATVGQDL